MAFAASALLARLSFASLFAVRPVFLPLVATVLAGAVGGFFAGMVTLTLSNFIHMYYFVPQFFTLEISKFSAPAAVSLVTFNIISLLVLIIFRQNQTAKRKAQQHLQNALQVSSAINSAKDAVIGKDLDGTVISWNEGAKDLYGYSGKQILGKSIAQIIPKNKPNEMHEILRAARSGKKVDSYETIRVTKDGREVNVSVTVSPIRDAEGGIVGAVSISRDISEQYRIREEVARSRNQLEVVLENVVDGVTVQNSSGRVTFVNLTAANMAGFTTVSDFLSAKPDDILGRYNMYDETGAPLDIAQLPGRRALKGEATPELVVKYSPKDGGDFRWVHIRSRPIFNPQGEVELVVNVMHDFTSRREQEEQKDEFIQVASHELRTPLTAMKLYAQSLLRSAEKQEVGSELVSGLRVINSQADRLSRLVSNVLDVAQIDSGKISYRPRNFDIIKLLSNTIEDTKGLLPNNFEFTPKGHLWVDGDPDRIQQVVVNLLSNASQHSPEHSTIKVSVSPENGQALVRVEDKGEGIPREKLMQLFERFYQVNSKSSVGVGLGLGLYISKKIIDRHGGKIYAESVSGEGSAFSFSIPLTLASKLMVKAERLLK